MTVLLLLKGQPGSGKSTLGRKLASVLNLTIIDKDDARDAFQAFAIDNPHIDWNTMSYDVLFNVTEAQLRCGMGCIIDSPLARRELFARASQLAEKYVASIALVECVAGNATVWKERLELRGSEDAGTARAHKPGSMADVEVVMQRNNGSERWSEAVNLPCKVEVDTTAGSVETQVVQVMKALAAAGLIERSKDYEKIVQ